MRWKTPIEDARAFLAKPTSWSAHFAWGMAVCLFVGHWSPGLGFAAAAALGFAWECAWGALHPHDSAAQPSAFDSAVFILGGLCGYLLILMQGA